MILRECIAASAFIPISQASVEGKRTFFIRVIVIVFDSREKATGNGKSRTYILSAKVYREQDNIVGYIHQTGIDSAK